MSDDCVDENRVGPDHLSFAAAALADLERAVLLTAADDGSARLWDVQTDQEVRRFAGHAGQVTQAIFSSDGPWIATSGDDHTARLWDVQTGQEVRRFVAHTAVVEAVAISPDGQYVATASEDHTVELWHTDYHEAVRYLCAHMARDRTAQERAQYGITDKEPTCPAP